MSNSTKNKKRKLKETRESRHQIGVVRTLHNKIKNMPIDEAEREVQAWISNIDVATRAYAFKAKIKKLIPKYPEPKTSDQAKAQKRMLGIFEIVEDLKPQEAMHFMDCLLNAIAIHKRKRLDPLKVKDLNIDLAKNPKPQMDTEEIVGAIDGKKNSKNASTSKKKTKK